MFKLWLLLNYNLRVYSRQRRKKNELNVDKFSTFTYKTIYKINLQTQYKIGKNVLITKQARLYTLFFL